MTAQTIPLNKRPTNQKSKGNKYERDTAKKLSNWMFGDPVVLYRHEDSGARKVVYTGDIIPKSLSKFTWRIFPFVIECKNGYKDNIPNLMNQNHLRLWLKKLLSERTDEQRIPFFIAQYHCQIPILLTTIILKHNYQLALMTDENEFFYVYRFNDLLKLNFMSIMPDWFSDVIKKDVIQHNIINPDDVIEIAEKITEPKKETKKQPNNNVEDKQLTKKEQNEILGEIIGEILGI